MPRNVLSAKLHVEYRSPNAKEIAAIENAIFPETKNKSRCRLKAAKKKEEASNGYWLSLYFESSDLASLRASLNTNLRLISSAIKTLRVVEERNA